MSDWNFADVWERIADLQPDLPAVVRGDDVRTWRRLDERADALARRLLDAGLGHQAKVAQYLYNGPEYLEALFACFKASSLYMASNVSAALGFAPCRVICRVTGWTASGSFSSKSRITR